MANATKNKAAKNTAKTVKTVKNETVKKGATYTFGGEYYCREDKGLTAKTYELAVTFPELLKAPLSVFKKGVSTTGHPIRNLMIKKYPDFTSIRTYSVIGVVNNTNVRPVKTNDISIMDVEQLKKYIAENELGISVEVYDNQIEKIREAIHLAENDPEKFEKVYADDVRDYEYRKQLEDLNNGSDGDENEDVDDLLDDLDGDENDTNE